MDGLNRTAAQCQSEAEESLGRILSEEMESLDNFIFNRASEDDLRIAKVFISFSIAVHYAIRSQIGD